MSDLPNPTVEPLWGFPRVRDAVLEKSENGGDTKWVHWLNAIRIARCVEHEYEADRVRLHARIAELERANAELEAQLAERGEWEVVPDGLYERENDIPMRIMDGGRHIWTQYTIQGSILKENDHIFLEPDIRLCRRVQKEQANE